MLIKSRNKNPLKEIFENLKSKGMFVRYINYSDYCKKRGVSTNYVPLDKQDEKKAQLEYSKTQESVIFHKKAEKTEIKAKVEIKVEDLFI